MAKNNFFRFKQFTIFQQNIGLKVSTEACIFGAFLPVQSAQNILDIGTGTGLLALMMAQKNPNAMIDAIDISDIACLQAKENVEKSIFYKKINVFHQKIQDFYPKYENKDENKYENKHKKNNENKKDNENKKNEEENTEIQTDKKYDFILSNPPFFQNHLPSQNTQKQQAKHTSTLDFEDLVRHGARLLAQKGQFWVLLPPVGMQVFSQIAQKYGLFPFEVIQIFQHEKHQQQQKIFREISGFGFLNTNQEIINQENINIEIQKKSFCIYDLITEVKMENGQEITITKNIYTSECKALLQDFYLFL